MPPQLLPASAAAFAPRASSVNVVLGSTVEPWLTQTLKRVNRVKRPLNNVPQHQKCLTETLSSPNAIWTLASIMLAKAPDADLTEDENPLVEAIRNFDFIHVEAYIVHVDMVLRNEVAFKLTPDTIEALIEFHKDVFCVNAKANTPDWADKEQQCKKLHDDFIQAVNRFVYRAPATALEGLEEDGAGELLSGRSDEVKSSIVALMKPLRQPPPRMIEVVRQPTLLPSSSINHSLWSQAHSPSPMPAPVEAWRVLPSTSTVASTSADSSASLWATLGISDVHISPPAPAFSQPFSSAGLFYSAPMVSAPIPALPLPSMLAPPCGVSVGYNSFAWDRYQEYAATI